MRETACNVLQTIAKGHAGWEGGVGAHSKTGQIDWQRVPRNSTIFEFS